ncbi:hypothetical protein QAD02_016142 [Eretmocerus hayati]|uniref:Uncharacterized protein n=1 Tax=Eretmocerus hayati TaxID=131215 RepID=A0ACC2PF18_9HYME|nr:hypothetical protein QAD02_016142 [Eretmocerus hayati]
MAPSLRDALPQIRISCSAHAIVIQAGVNMAYSTILEDGLRISKDDISWIASLVTISVPIGALIVGPLMDKFGRKKICLLTCIPNIISWAMMMTTNSVPIICAARVIAGFSSGLSTVALVYISEITNPHIRPMLLCLNSVFVSFGILMTFFLGVWLSWDQIAIVFFVLNIFILLIVLSIPESPYWLVCFGKTDSYGSMEQVKVVLKKLNKSQQAYRQELERINEISENFDRDKKFTSFTKKISYIYEQLQSPSAYKPTMILFVLLAFQQLTGVYVIIFYALSVFESIGNEFGHGLNKYDAMVILGIIRFVMSVLTALFSKKFGRRILCIISALGMSIFMLFLALHVHYSSSDGTSGQVNIDDKYKMIPLVLVLLYVCACSLGFMIIPWTLIGELLPISIKGLMGGAMVSIAYVFMFGMIKGYPSVVTYWGSELMFFTFSVTSLASCFFVYFFVPETLGKSFLEIEEYFASNK